MNLSEFVGFQKPEGVPIMDYLHSIKNTDANFLNYLKFFDELGHNIGGLPKSAIHTEFHEFFIQHMEENECHKNAGSLVNNEQFQMVYGFVDHYMIGYNSTKYIQTNQHSFLIQEYEGSYGIFDPTISAANLRKKVEALSVGQNYFGVHIPHELFEEIKCSQGKKGQRFNISGYFKNTVFPSDELTDKTIAQFAPYKKIAGI